MFLFQQVSIGAVSTSKHTPAQARKPLNFNTNEAVTDSLSSALTASFSKGTRFKPEYQDHVLSALADGINKISVFQHKETTGKAGLCESVGEVDIKGFFSARPLVGKELSTYSETFNLLAVDEITVKSLEYGFKDRYDRKFVQEASSANREALSIALKNEGFKMSESDLDDLIAGKKYGIEKTKDNQTFIIKASRFEKNTVNIFLKTGAIPTAEEANNFVTTRLSMKAYIAAQLTSYLEKLTGQSVDEVSFKDNMVRVQLGSDVFMYDLDDLMTKYGSTIFTQLRAGMASTPEVPDEKVIKVLADVPKNAQYSYNYENINELKDAADAIYGKGYSNNFVQNILPTLYEVYWSNQTKEQLVANNAFMRQTTDVQERMQFTQNYKELEDAKANDLETVKKMGGGKGSAGKKTKGPS